MGGKPSSGSRPGKVAERSKASPAGHPVRAPGPGGVARPLPAGPPSVEVEAGGNAWPPEEPVEEVVALDGAAFASASASVDLRWAWSSPKGAAGTPRLGGATLLPGSVLDEADYTADRQENAGLPAFQSSAVDLWVPPAPPSTTAIVQEADEKTPRSSPAEGGRDAGEAAAWPTALRSPAQCFGGGVQPCWPGQHEAPGDGPQQSAEGAQRDDGQPANVERLGCAKRRADNLSDLLQMQLQATKDCAGVSSALAGRYASWPEGTQLQILKPLGGAAANQAGRQPYATLVCYDMPSNTFKVRLPDGTAQVVPARQVRRAPWTVDSCSVHGYSTSLLAKPGGASSRARFTYDEPELLT